MQGRTRRNDAGRRLYRMTRPRLSNVVGFAAAVVEGESRGRA